MLQSTPTWNWRNKLALLCLVVEVMVLSAIISLIIGFWLKNSDLKSYLNVFHQRSRRYNDYDFESNSSYNEIKNSSQLVNLIYFKEGCDISPFWANFGYCDDSTNTAECEYDNGDCCLPSTHQEFCTACICHIDGKRHAKQHPIKEFKCSEIQKNDGICQDVVNFRECSFDLKDCCKERIWCQVGDDCICHLDGTRHPSISKLPAGSIQSFIQFLKLFF